jgi:hypothetical protein
MPTAFTDSTPKELIRLTPFVQPARVLSLQESPVFTRFSSAEVLHQHNKGLPDLLVPFRRHNQAMHDE